MFVIDENWVFFMESPIAILEEYGLSIRTINSIEQEYGIYIKDIQCMRDEDLAKCSHIGPVHKKKLKECLLAFYQDVITGVIR